MSHIDVARFIDERPLSAFQRRIYISGMLITLLDGLDLQTVSLAAPLLAEQWGVAPQSFGPAFAAGPTGMAVGALVLGTLADRIGRKRLIIGATLLFGMASLLTALATSLTGLAVLRFLTGVGLGGVMPNLIALSIEYAPSRLRGTLTTLTFCGLSLGSMLAGVLGASLMPAYGWQSIFIVGGVLPLLVAAWLPWGLPESIRFLVARGAEHSAQVARVLNKIAPSEMISANTTFSTPDASGEKVSFLRLFGRARTTPTVLLTLIVILNSFSLYFVLNWLPTLMKIGGLTTREALLSSVVLNAAGGAGAIAIGWFMDRYGSVRIMTITCFLAACGVAGIGLSAGSVGLIPVLIIAGGTVLCTLLGMYVVIAEIYPTTIRATGAGFALGVGRVGSMIGPMAGGWALAAGWSVQAAFFMAAVPVLFGAGLLQVVARSPRRFH